MNVYSEETANAICEWLAEGGTLVEFCKQGGTPGRSTVYQWKDANPEFSKRFDEAMLQGCHALLDETLEIADDSRNDWIAARAKAGDESAETAQANAENVQRSKLRIWARHELIKRKRPDVFSDKVQMEHSGKVGLESLIAGAGAKLDE